MYAALAPALGSFVKNFLGGQNVEVDGEMHGGWKVEAQSHVESGEVRILDWE